MNIQIGTSGWYYDDWVGPVYPTTLSMREWFSYYAKIFRTVEINSTFYRVPSEKTLEGWIEKAKKKILWDNNDSINGFTYRIAVYL